MKRALVDPAWASFVTRASPTSYKLLARDYMKADLQRGQQLGQFSFADLNLAVDFMMGASTAGIAALGKGVPDPELYIEGSVRMALLALGCSGLECERALKFSREYLGGRPMKAGSDEAPDHAVARSSHRPDDGWQ